MRLLKLLPFTFVMATGIIRAQSQPVTLPNGWHLTPAGKSFALGDLPLNLEVSRSGRYMAVTNNGQSTQMIQLVDTKAERVVDSAIIGKSWFGLAFTSDERTLYVSGGHDNWIVRYDIDGGKLKRRDSIVLDKPWPVRVGPAGIALDERRNRLYVVTREDKQLYILDTDRKSVIAKYGLDGEAYDCKISPDGNELYISCWGCDKILRFDLHRNIWRTPVTVGDNPNEMLLTRDGKMMFVSNANDNSVSVIDLKNGRVIETLDAALFPNSPSGSTSNSIALDPASKRLYIANANNNCLAVFDVSKPGSSRSLGFIPTGWYPTSVRFLNGKLWVANGKGMTSKANPFGPSPIRKKEEVIHHGFSTKDPSQVEYIGGLFKGTMSIILTPDEAKLAAYSRQVYANTPYTLRKLELADSTAPGFPIPMKAGQSSPIKYVFYVIKENRTYDQVLSDIPGGRGDTSLLLFGRKVTPNQHWLAREYVLLDNFYVDAEVSADGHNWSTAAYANDFVEKTWPTSYGGRGGNYDYEGTRRVAFPKGGFIWDNCKRAGISYRTYGEFADDNKANYETIEGHFCPNYSSWDMNYQDISREKDWQRDFDSLLQINQVPRFNTIRFGNDHTSGMAKGAYSPYASVADNDLAVGRFLEHLSHSKIWKESAVFILEDDAQNGADHVDAHRSIAFVVSPYVKRRYVDHTMYSTTSMLRTMELILGLPPMSQYDAAATPMWRCFTDKPDFTPIKALEPGVSIDERNAWVEPLSRISETWNLAEVDAVPDREFNEVLWKALKGLDSEMPAPRRAAWLSAEKDDD
jgi:DNA-binding beta-propeller fold protein YncE